MNFSAYNLCWFLIYIIFLFEFISFRWLQDDESYILPVLLQFDGQPEIDEEVWFKFNTWDSETSLFFSWYVYKYIKCLVNHSPQKLWNLLHLLMLMLCCIDTQVIDVILFQCVEKRKTFWRADIAFYCRVIFCIDFHHCNAQLLLKGVEERNMWGEDGLIGLEELRNFLRRRRCNTGSYSTCFSKCYVVKSFVS